MAGFREITSGLRFPEGPVALSDGSVLVVEIARGALSRVAPDGAVSVVADCGGGPNGAAIGPDGAVYVCNNGGFAWLERGGRLVPGHQPADYLGGRIQRVTLDGEVTDLYTEVDGHPLRGPNDLVFDADGGFYFTDLGKRRPRDTDRGGLYYATPDGRHIAEIAYPLTEANGVGLSPDGSRVYVAETVTGRVWCWDVEGPGRLRRDGDGPAGARLLHGFSGYRPLDSLAVDSEGNVCVATLVTGEISVLSPEGSLRHTVRPPRHDPHVTNICFGGPDLRTAYITSSGWGLLYATEWHCPGLELNHNA
ncbi:SMP-30/gluconolactonase/LRE family protein [Saccharopolyspora rosea]|uniref:SMP-30/gluconolactonase/LRE family protein n=1 Tax=Saccharopolyspora rosea TaxID=524884 RepID=A0ABW3FRZ1_9PSEU|nr:SMP-30/gluconolactonase/LRE family protein [Saccharopolyspora rosea]